MPTRCSALTLTLALLLTLTLALALTLTPTQCTTPTRCSGCCTLRDTYRPDWLMERHPNVTVTQVLRVLRATGFNPSVVVPEAMRLHVLARQVSEP